MSCCSATTSGVPLDPQYGSYYRELYERHWWWRAREEAFLRFLRRHLPQKTGLRILDIGCGDGLSFDRLAQFGSVEGIEPDAHLVDPANPHADHIYVMPFDKNFRRDKPYGLLLMLDVLEHLDNPREALECAHDLLEPGGCILITVPAFQFLWTNHDVINHHRIRYRRLTLFPLLHEAGFSVVKSVYWYQWTVPAKVIVGALERIRKAKPNLPSIPAEWLNKTLFWLSRTEQELCGRVGIPFGSTLAVFCTRK